MGPPSSSSSRRLACRAGARVESLLLCARTTGQNRFTTVKLKGHSRASFFPRGNEGKGKNIFTARVRARRKGRGEKLSENRKNGDDVHYRPVNSHSLTTHFLDRRRHFLFFFSSRWRRMERSRRTKFSLPFEIRGKGSFSFTLFT